MIAQCLQAAGITQIVWIDDHFAEKPRQKNVDEIIAGLRAIYGQQPGELRLPGLPALTLSTPLDDLIDQCEEALGGLDNTQVQAVAVAMGKILPVPAPAPGAAADIPDEDYNALLAEFGDRVIKMSFSQWTEAGAERHAKAGKDTLFLVDKEFSREETSYTGLDILASLTQSSNACCILFTYRSTEATQEDNRINFAKEKKIPSHRFAVVAKLGEETPITKRFARALRAVFIHRQTGDLAHRLVVELNKSLQETCDELVSQSITDIDQALFANSIQEGASELDVLLRILLLKQRRDARNAFKGDLRELLLAIRKFRADIAEQAKGDPAAPMDKFREWRKWEIFEEGELINPVHAPLSCGDIFECKSPEGMIKRFVLLVQPCDIMVRDDGERNAEVGLFALVREENKPAPQGITFDQALMDLAHLKVGAQVNVTVHEGGTVTLSPVSTVIASEEATKPTKEGAKDLKRTMQKRPAGNANRVHEIADVFGQEQVWQVDFLSAFVVDLSLLDLCVFNTDGMMRMHGELVVANHAVMPGYAKVFSKRQNEAVTWMGAKPKAAPRPISLGKRAKTYAPKILEQKIVEYPVQRVGRLEPATAHAILAAWASYQTRAALDHDFARSGADVEAGAPADTGLPKEDDAAVLAAASPTTGSLLRNPLRLGQEFLRRILRRRSPPN